MRVSDIIIKKRNGKELEDGEIEYLIKGYTKGIIPDYQMSALLMAIYFNGLNKRETSTLTKAMAASGEIIDLSSISGIKVDKHSTGGVGDKTTLIVAPIVAACGVPVPKMSGRGLGHTGGTVDKLEAFPGYCTDIPQVLFVKLLKTIGISIMGQTGNIAPADKKLYALRDVTGTVENMSLIAASIMSKKLASGADAIVLDVKTGSGAFMKTLEESIELAKTMVDIGISNGKQMVALVTNMNVPLGSAIGNNLELIEVIDTLSGRTSGDLTKISIELAANMLNLAQKGSIERCRMLAQTAIDSGAALHKLKALVAAQGGDVKYIDDTTNFQKSRCVNHLYANCDGYISSIDSERCGLCSVELGAGRNQKESAVNFSAGIILHKNVGDKVNKGDNLATIHTDMEGVITQVRNDLLSAFTITENPPSKEPLIYARITKDGIEKITMK